jgi:hypothetical protein
MIGFSVLHDLWLVWLGPKSQGFLSTAPELPQVLKSKLQRSTPQPTIIYWLVVSNMAFVTFHFIYGMSSFPTDELHHFSRWAHCTTNHHLGLVIILTIEGSYLNASTLFITLGAKSFLARCLTPKIVIP